MSKVQEWLDANYNDLSEAEQSALVEATMAEMGLHKGNFEVIGFKPEGELIYRLDAADSGATLPATFAGVNDDAACISTVGAVCAAAYVTWNNHPVSTATGVGGAAAATNRLFTVFVAADLDGSQADRWQINQNKNLVLVQDGTE